MTDKELIKQEIERRIEQCYRILSQDLLEIERKETNCCLQQYKELLQFIDSLPEESASEDLENQYKSNMRYQHAYTQDDLMKTKNEDLEEEIKKLDNWYPVEIQHIREIAHHFAEWGRNHFEDKSEMTNNDLEKAAVSVIKKLGGMEPDDNVSYHEVKIFKAGAEWHKQQMMKDAVEGEYWIGEIHLDTLIIQGYNDGDRIKFIIIKMNNE